MKGDQAGASLDAKPWLRLGVQLTWPSKDWQICHFPIDECCPIWQFLDWVWVWNLNLNPGIEASLKFLDWATSGLSFWPNGWSKKEACQEQGCREDGVWCLQIKGLSQSLVQSSSEPSLKRCMWGNTGQRDTWGCKSTFAFRKHIQLSRLCNIPRYSKKQLFWQIQYLLIIERQSCKQDFQQHRGWVNKSYGRNS